jgi:tetratricopeptide (TPR) repeat protein
MNTKEKVLIHKGMDMVKRMQFQEAVEIFDRVLAMNSQIPEAWNNKGVALFRLGRLEDALICYESSLSIDPDNLEAMRNKGFVLRYLGRMEEALQTYDSVLQRGDEALDMESRATVLMAMGRLEEALDCLYQALRTQPLDRFEEEVRVLRGMIEQRDGQASS